MNLWEMAVAATLLLIATEHAVAVAIFLRYCGRPPRRVADPDLPEVMLVLSLRGADAALGDCLQAVCQQDYPRYRVKIIVDSRGDPSWEIVERALRGLPASHVEVRLLEKARETCSLKCSALLQATDALGESVDVVAFVDADVVPHRGWLRELVAPLSDPRVGAATGNRWYAPRVGQWGSLVRSVWNVGVVANMFFWGIPWGGTLAVRADVLRRSRLRELWAQAGCDDVPLKRVLGGLRLKLVFVPELLLVDRGECSLQACLRFVARQFLWVRLYHPLCWWTCAAAHLLQLGCYGAAPVLCGMAAWAGRWAAARWLAGALAFNLLVSFGLVFSLSRYARRVMARQGERFAENWLRMALALPLTQVFAAAAFLWSLFARHIEWRGIRYQIGGPWDIHMLGHRPWINAAGEGPVRAAV